MIQTADDASYLAPPVNFIETGVWADNSVGLSRYFQRPPGYGMIYGAFYLFLGKYAFWGLKLLQILCFFFSIVMMGKLLERLSINERLLLLFMGSYAFIPLQWLHLFLDH